MLCSELKGFMDDTSAYTFQRANKSYAQPITLLRS
jgi:hypothetical protein